MTDIRTFFSWYIAITLLGMAFMPISQIVFRKFKGLGWIFSKVLGVVCAGFCMWILASFKIMPFTRRNSILVCLAMCLVCAVPFYKGIVSKKYILPYKQRGLIAFYEITFLFVFSLFTLLKTFSCATFIKENNMVAYSLFKSLERSESFPLNDIWLSGKTLNFPYFGLYLLGFISKLTNTSADYTVSLGISMMMALTCMLTFSLLFNVIYGYLDKIKETGSKKVLYPLFFGTFGGVLVTFYENILIKTESEETLAHLFVASDLRYNLINVVIMLTILGILYAYLKECEVREKAIVKSLFSPWIILTGFLLGIMSLSSPADSSVVYILFVMLLGFANMYRHKDTKKMLVLTILEGVFLFLISRIVSLMFIINYKTPPIVLKKVLSIVDIKDFVTTVSFFFLSGIALLVIVLVKKEKLSSDGFVSIVFGFSFVLFFMAAFFGVESVKSARPVSHLMLSKILLSIVFSYSLFRVIVLKKIKLFNIALYMVLVLSILGALCLPLRLYRYMGKEFSFKHYEGLDASVYVRSNSSKDFFATKWLLNNISGEPVILEASGDDYSEYARVSSLTGLPTVLGWSGFEQEINATNADINKEIIDRKKDIETIYTSKDITLVKELINKYNIEYIYVGALERETYEAINQSELQKLGQVVYPENFNLNFSDVITYIIKIE